MLMPTAGATITANSWIKTGATVLADGRAKRGSETSDGLRNAQAMGFSFNAQRGMLSLRWSGW